MPYCVVKEMQPERFRFPEEPSIWRVTSRMMVPRVPTLCEWPDRTVARNSA